MTTVDMCSCKLQNAQESLQRGDMDRGFRHLRDYLQCNSAFRTIGYAAIGQHPLVLLFILYHEYPLLMEFRMQMEKGKPIRASEKAAQQKEMSQLSQQLNIQFRCANNPYRTDSVQFWIHEWVASADGWDSYAYGNDRAYQDIMDSRKWPDGSGRPFAVPFSRAENEKKIPGPYDDNRTAAEHYIYVRSFPNDKGIPLFVRYLYKTTGFAWAPGYQALKAALAELKRNSASPASKVQMVWGIIGWWDQFESNFNKVMNVTPGECFTR